MKVINKDKLKSEKDKKSTLVEKEILKSVESPFLVKLHYSFQNQERLYFILDYLNGGELFYHL